MDHLEAASIKFKHFYFEGWPLRLLPYDHFLDKKLSTINPQMANKLVTSLPKPDNLDAKCNIVVKGLQPNKREQSLETYFTEKYGAVKSCKIAKDPTSGNSLGYGFVWFERDLDASAAMLDFKKGNSKNSD